MYRFRKVWLNSVLVILKENSIGKRSCSTFGALHAFAALPISFLVLLLLPCSNAKALRKIFWVL
jgi:hypothetical protein